MTACNSTADNFREQQYAFTKHIRDPENTDAPEDIEDRRLQIYRDLLFNNVESFIASSFPVLRKLFDDDAWKLMIRDYFKNHVSHTPLFPKMPQEFLHYLQNERQDTENDYPFLFELAHYEWVELAIDLDKRTNSLEGLKQTGDFLQEIPVLNPVSMPLSYEWPVHLIGPNYLPETKPEQATYIIVYRTIEFKTQFLELNPISAMLIEKLQQNETQSGRDILLTIAAEIQHPDPDVVVTGGQQIMQDMCDKQVILGTK